MSSIEGIAVTDLPICPVPVAVRTQIVELLGMKADQVRSLRLEPGLLIVDFINGITVTSPFEGWEDR